MREQRLIEGVNSAIDKLLYLELSSLEKERREDAYLAVNEAVVALEELKDHTQFVRILGCYQSESMQAVEV